MKLLLLSAVIAFFLPNSTVKSLSNNEYDVKNIPLELLNDADVIFRKDEVKFVVEDYNTALYKVVTSVTIFTKDGQHHGRIKLYYDKFRSVEELEGTIYDANGEVVRELDDSDVEDYSDFEIYSIYSDNRVKFAELYHDQFPYTVEYKYEISYDGYIGWPSWFSRSSIDAVEYSSFEVSVPQNYKFRYWCKKKDIEPFITKGRNDEKYFWSERNLLKLSDEKKDEDLEDIATILRIAPSEFEIDGYKGNMESWKDFGLWYYKLSEKKDNLEKTFLSELDDKLNSSSSFEEKVRILYNYLQKRSRYVSVQFGIGSWQPYDAAYVHKNGYGDCKALSNYMIALLNYAGITAYPVLINNGHFRTPLISEFPSNQFNHVIVCVPAPEDTLWLECTSQINPAGDIGWSNENRDALMVTPEGGFIVRTPTSESQKNVQIKNANVNLSGSGEANVSVRIKWTGNQHDYALVAAEKTTGHEKEKWIKELLKVPDISLSNFEFINENKNKSEIELKLGLKLMRYGSVTGKRMFIHPNLMERRNSAPKEITEKLSPVRFKYPYLDIDSVYYQLPEKFSVESIPGEINLESSFGSFSSKTLKEGDHSLLFIRKLEVNSYSVPPENYPEYQKFFANIVKADKQQVVLVKD